MYCTSPSSPHVLNFIRRLLLIHLFPGVLYSGLGRTRTQIQFKFLANVKRSFYILRGDAKTRKKMKNGLLFTIFGPNRKKIRDPYF
jgi:hypothetical protein